MVPTGAHVKQIPEFHSWEGQSGSAAKTTTGWESFSTHSASVTTLSTDPRLPGNTFVVMKSFVHCGGFYEVNWQDKAWEFPHLSKIWEICTQMSADPCWYKNKALSVFHKGRKNVSTKAAQCIINHTLDYCSDRRSRHSPTNKPLLYEETLSCETKPGLFLCGIWKGRREKPSWTRLVTCKRPKSCIGVECIPGQITWLEPPGDKACLYSIVFVY